MREGELSAVLRELSAVLVRGASAGSFPRSEGRAAAGEGGAGKPVVPRSAVGQCPSPWRWGGGIKTKRKLAAGTVTGSFVKASSKKVYL